MRNMVKAVFTFFLIIAGGFLILWGTKKIIKIQDEKKYIEEVKKGWYVEILNDYINVRKKPDQYSSKIGIVNKKEVYEVVDFNADDPNHYWYLIKLKNGSEGWISNRTNGSYLKDYNNPTDIAIPIIQFKENEYHVVSINDINYDHLKVWDDRDDYVITHIVYHEVDTNKNINQYWIKYTIEDASGKSSSKTQKIVFENPPDEEDVIDFAEYKRD